METALFVLVGLGFFYVLYRASEWAAESRFQRRETQECAERARMRRIYLDTPRYPPV